MNLLRHAGRGASRILGHDSLLIRSARPAYNWLLDVLSGGKGIEVCFNGKERFRIDPNYRQHFPENKDPAVCAYLRKHVKAGDVCVNVGAHVGLYALCLAEWSGRGGRVVAFEPNPTTREILNKHLRLNQVEGRVVVRAEALSDVTGELSFSADGMEGVSRLGSPNPEIRTAALTTVTVAVGRLDDVCAEMSLSPTWVTVDVEGYEANVLRGAHATIEANRRTLRLLVEMHPPLWLSAGSSREEMVRLLDELKLEMKPLEGQVDPLGEHGIVLLTPRM